MSIEVRRAAPSPVVPIRSVDSSVCLHCARSIYSHDGHTWFHMDSGRMPCGRLSE